MILHLNEHSCEEDIQSALSRSVLLTSHHTYESVKEIVEQVKSNRDLACLDYAKKFDGFDGTDFELDQESMEKAYWELPAHLKEAFEVARSNIEAFHQRQKPQEYHQSNAQGVIVGMKYRPYERVALYIPGGSAPLVSTVFMLALPAKLAQTQCTCAFTPASSPQKIHSVLKAAFYFCGIHRVFALGGAQAIAAAAYGTKAIPKCDKIFGPGNRFVDLAKQMVSVDPLGPAIDLEAGPSEVLVIADSKAKGKWIAADLLAQLEHGPDSSALLITTDLNVALETQKELFNHLSHLSRRDILKQSLGNCRLIVVPHMDLAFKLSNDYGPEHLILHTQNPHGDMDKVIHAGSLFLGEYTPETLGDYLSGTNHVLPTNGLARKKSGVGLADFYKKMSYQSANKESLHKSFESLRAFCQVEGLDAHCLAASVRLDEL